MSNHTPEPWFIKREGYSTVYVEARIGGGWIQEVAACGPTEKGSEQQEANARRIVACVNALTHVSTEQLETGEMLNMGLAIETITRQRDELLATLEALVAVADNGCAEAWRQEWFEAREVIASVKERSK